MPVPRDHAIAVQIRSILDRRWVDASLLDFGSVNGVVYLRGELRRHPRFPASRSIQANDLAFFKGLERALRAVPGVKDVSFELVGFEHGGDHWETNQVRTA